MFIRHTIAAIAIVAAPTVGLATTAGADTRTPTFTTEKTAPERGGATCRDLPAVEVLAGQTYHGTDDDDVIFVSGADAKVYGHGGDDLICASSPNDAGARIYGGDGNDIVVGVGSHLVFGDAGNDVIILNGGLNEAWGGAGNDIINGAGASQLLAYGDAGNDIINGSPGPDWLGGYDGDDLILGWGGDDLIFGMSGDDDLRGGNGFDEIGGATGDDTCIDFAGPVDGANMTDCENIAVSLGGGIGGLSG